MLLHATDLSICIVLQEQHAPVKNVMVVCAELNRSDETDTSKAYMLTSATKTTNVKRLYPLLIAEVKRLGDACSSDCQKYDL
jgi:hypothetical protein